MEAEMTVPKQLEVIEQGQSVATRPQPITPMEMLNAAVERGDAIENLTQLMDLNDRWEAAQAKKAFIEAKAEFKANAPTVFKDMQNTQYRSMYSSIGNVVNTVNVALSKYGLDASWDYDQTESGIKVTCILTHSQGHSTSVSLSGPPDTSGSKNPIQQIKSTTTYLKLATFEAVTGIASKEGNKDDDGNSAGVAPINDVQVKTINDLLDDTASDIEQFKNYFGISDVKDLPARRFQEAMNIFAAKRKLKNG
jgi:hypothetical protein